jgi:hypothetical protein
MKRVMAIIRKYQNPEGTGNIVACQTQLLKNGLKEYEKL